MMTILSFQIVLGVLSPILGRLMDQYAMRWMVMAGALSTAVGLFLLSLATSLWQITVIYMTLLPVGMLLCGTLSSQTMVSKWFTGNRGLAIGLSSMGTSIGGLIVPLVVAYLIEAYDWQSAYLILSIVSLLLLLPLNYVVLKFEPPRIVVPRSGAGTLDQRVWTSQEILRSRTFWIPVLGLIPINAAFGGVQFNIGAYMADLGYGQVVAAQLIATTSVMMILGKLFFGSMGDRFDHRRLYWIMAALLVVSLFFYEGAPTRLELTLAASLQGFATGGVMPMMGIMYSARFGTVSFGRVLGYVNMFLMIGSFGSIFSGWIFDLTRSYDAAFWVFGLLLLPSILVMKFLPEVALDNEKVA